MSMETWKKEFYPIDASKTSENGALAHSLRKWKGLTRASLKKHGLVKGSDYLNYIVFQKDQINEYTCGVDGVDGVDSDNYEFKVTDETCALCHHYRIDDLDCGKCPLLLANNNKPCDESMRYNRSSPYESFLEHDNPKPMIRLLEKAIKCKENK